MLANLGIEHVASGAFDIYQNGMVDHFNTLVTQFAKDLKLAFAGRVDFKTQLNLIHSLTSCDKHFFIKQFYDHANAKLPDHDELPDDMRDDFVLHRIRDIPLFRSLQLHVHWADIPENTKGNIWKYIQELWKCSADYHNESKETMIDRAMDVVHTPQFHDTMLSLIKNLSGGVARADTVNVPEIQSFVTTMLNTIKGSQTHGPDDSDETEVSSVDDAE